MREFLFNYGWIILAVVVAAAYFYVVYMRKGKETMLIELRELAYRLMLAAEKKFPGADGSDKFKWVIEMIRPHLPRSMLLVLPSDEELIKYLQKIYDEIKDYLDDGKINNISKGIQ